MLQPWIMMAVIWAIVSFLIVHIYEFKTPNVKRFAGIWKDSRDLHANYTDPVAKKRIFFKGLREPQMSWKTKALFAMLYSPFVTATFQHFSPLVSELQRVAKEMLERLTTTAENFFHTFLGKDILSTHRTPCWMNSANVVCFMVRRALSKIDERLLRRTCTIELH